MSLKMATWRRFALFACFLVIHFVNANKYGTKTKL